VGEDEGKKIVGLAPTSAPIAATAQWATEANKNKKPHSLAQKDTQDKSPPPSYPPAKGILWDTIQGIIDGK